MSHRGIDPHPDRARAEHRSDLSLRQATTGQFAYRNDLVHGQPCAPIELAAKWSPVARLLLEGRPATVVRSIAASCRSTPHTSGFGRARYSRVVVAGIYQSGLRGSLRDE